MDPNFYARGKILITSEFMILHGARALAVPLKSGQSLELTNKKELGKLHWTAEYNGVPWFEAVISLDDLKVLVSTSDEKALNLLNMLKKLVEIQAGFKEKLYTNDVLTRLEFDPGFGFGSSSTLTSLLAQWAGIDPMQLHFSISRGSGYDVACANAESAILYQMISDMPVIESVDFQPAFIDKMWLIYLGKKQDSGKSVAAFLNNYNANQEDIDLYSRLTCEMLRAESMHEFGKLMTEHEKRLSEILDIPVLKDLRFRDLGGYVKSLGAWGGDFALLLTPWNKETLSSYLTDIGIGQFFAYNELAI